MEIITFANAFITLRGKWKCNRRYRYLDAVFYNGSLYIANKKHICTGISPECNRAWMLAAKGIDEKNNEEQIKKLLLEHEEEIKKLLSEHEAQMEESLSAHEEKTEQEIADHKDEVEKRLSEQKKEVEDKLAEQEKKSSEHEAAVDKHILEHEAQIEERLSAHEEKTEQEISDHKDDVEKRLYEQKKEVEDKLAEQEKKSSEHDAAVDKHILEHDAQIEERLSAHEEKTEQEISDHKDDVEKRLSEQEKEVEDKLAEQKEQTEKLISDHTGLTLESGVHGFPQGEEGQLLTLKEDKLAWATIEQPTPTRIPLTQNTTWYVRTDGDDANDGSEDTPEKAFKTIQGCFNYLYSHFVQSHGDVIIRIGEGEFDGFELNGTHEGIHHIFMYGSGTDKTIITNKGTSNKGCIAVGSYKRVLLQNIKFLFDDFIVTANSNIISSDFFSYTRLYNCLMEIKESVGRYVIHGCACTNYSNLELNKGNEFVIKSTVDTSKIEIIFASRRSTIYSFTSITANGKMNLFLRLFDNSYFYSASSVKFIGTMTGTKYSCVAQSIVNTNGKGNILFGSINGSLSTGSNYY